MRGAKRGANGGRRRPTQGDHERQLMQLEGAYGHSRRRSAIVELRLVSGRRTVVEFGTHARYSHFERPDTPAPGWPFHSG
jgi:hypothetical protein